MRGMWRGLLLVLVVVAVGLLAGAEAGRATSNPYKVLGINQGATMQEIKKAYKTLALKWHPDKNDNSPESNQKFVEITEAYDISYVPHSSLMLLMVLYMLTNEDVTFKFAPPFAGEGFSFEVNGTQISVGVIFIIVIFKLLSYCRGSRTPPAPGAFQEASSLRRWVAGMIDVFLMNSQYNTALQIYEKILLGKVATVLSSTTALFVLCIQIL